MYSLKGGAVLKKTFFIIWTLIAVLTSTVAYADSQLFSCYTKIGDDPESNILEFEFDISENLPDDTQLVIALYIENKLDMVDFHTVAEVREILEYNLTADEKNKKVISVEHQRTPDSIKVFAWKNVLIPVCGENNLLTSESDYLKANDIIISQITLVISELDKLNRLYFKHEDEIKISNLLMECANDALTKKGSLLLTREFAQRYYQEPLSEVKQIYSAMDSETKSTFQNRITNNADLRAISYIIDYLGLKELLFM